jgi:hypothetical protein
MSKLSKSEREEIITKWLAGEENDEWDVKPLKEEGKYRVSKKKDSDHHEPDTDTDSTVYSEQSEKVPKTSASAAKKPVPKVNRKNTAKDDKIYEEVHEMNQKMLEYLKAIGEENERKKSKKELKKIVRNQVEKVEKVQKPDKQQGSDDEERQTVVIVQAPRYKRRRVDLRSLT